MKAHQRTTGLNDEWLTPPDILKVLGEFDLDPCAPDIDKRPWDTALHHYSYNGREKDWHGRVWCNPPFNRYERPLWMAKMAEHNNGILLVPAATETEAFHEYVWQKASAICFVKGRPHFHYIDGARAKANCGCSIALVAYGKNNIRILSASNLGKVVIL